VKRLAAVALLLAGCATAHVPPPTLEMAGGQEARLATLAKGRGLYIAKCSGCHRLHDVETYADMEWEFHVDDMIQRGHAKLDFADESMLLLYLTTANARD